MLRTFFEKYFNGLRCPAKQNAGAHGMRKIALGTRAGERVKRLFASLLLGGLMFLAGAPRGPAAAADPSFTASYFGKAVSSYSLAVGDVNGDGALDVIQGYQGAQSVIYLNDGRGGFGNGVPFGDFYYTTSIAVGDLNGDGALDIVQGNNYYQESRVYFNDGQGSFDAGAPFGWWHTYTYSIALGDLNGDGALDIVQGNNYQQSMVFFNDGRGGFDVSAPFGSGTDRTLSVAVGDVDGDNTLDIIQGNQAVAYTVDEACKVYFNDGQGGLGAAVPFSALRATSSVAVGDVNGDGLQDIVQGNDAQQTLVYLSEGGGIFGKGFPVGKAYYTTSIALGDMNGDGALDIVQGNNGQESMLYLNNQQGEFAAGLPFSGANWTSSVAVGNVNGDGALDILQGNNFQQSVVYLNNDGGGFETGTLLGESYRTQSVALGDVNFDLQADIVQGNWGQPSMVYANDRTGHFGAGASFGDAYNTSSIALGDLDGNGELDIVQGNNAQQSRIYLNDGVGVFGAGVPFGEALLTNSIAVGDVNGDGALDIVQGNGAPGSFQPGVVYLGDGGGGLDAGTSFGGDKDTRSIVLKDMNGDGALDIIQGNYIQQSVLYFNDGAGNFLVETPFGGSYDTTSLAAGDVNSDGRPDIIQGNDGQDSKLYLNNGVGGVGEGVSFGGVYMTQSVALADVNGDGALDIVQGNRWPAALVYLNNGIGDFDQGTAVGAVYPTQSIVLGDVNDDSMPDIIQGNENQASMVYWNDGVGGFDAGAPVGWANPTTTLAVGDVNGDGLLEVIQGNLGRPGVLYWNDGRGALAQATYFGSAAQVRSIAVADLDGDGDLDILQGNESQQSVVYWNDGQGGFASSTLFGEAWVTWSIVAGDVNGDGALDIVQGNDGQSMLYLNDKQGGFSAGAVLTDTVRATNSIVLGDVDGNGTLDIVQGNYQQQSLVYLNDGQGGWSAGAPFGEATSTYSLALGDLNGDGALDIVQGNYYQQSIVYWNDGRGGFAAGTPFGEFSSLSMALGDVNGDGALDVVQGNAGRQSKVYLNDGQGNFDAGVSLGGDYRTYSVAVGDMNRDGMLDIVQGNNRQPSFVYLNTRFSQAGLPNNLPSVSVTRPGGAPDADFYSTPKILSQAILPISYTLADPEGDAVGAVRAWYSLDGGGSWEAAADAEAGQDTACASADGLVAAWGFEEGGGAVALDASGNGYNLDLDGSGYIPTTPVTQSLYALNLNNNMPRNVSVSQLDALQDLTIALWIRPDVLPSPYGIERFVTLGNEKAVLRVENSDYHFYLKIDGAFWQIRMPGYLQVGVYQHLAGSYDSASRTMRLYYNGVEIASQLVTAPSPALMATGNGVSLGDAAGEGYQGLMDEVRIYNRALSAVEVAALAQNRLCACQSASSQSSSLLFDGVNDYALLPGDALGASKELTVEAWVKLVDPMRDQKILSKSVGGTGFILGVADGQIYPEFFDAAGNSYTFQAGKILAGEWTHLAVTWTTGDQIVGYVNGEVVYSLATGPDLLSANDEPLMVGAASWMDFFAAGQIDQVRLWSRALSADEIRANRAQSLPPRHNDVVGDWNFDENWGNQLNDRSVTGGQGLLAGGDRQPQWAGSAPAPASGPSGGLCSSPAPRFTLGSALQFDGQDDYVAVPDAPALNPANFTVEAWINADHWATNAWEGVIVGKDNWPGYSQGYALSAGDNGRLSLTLDCGGTWGGVASLPLMASGQWYHVAGEFDGSRAQIFINGLLVGVTSCAASPQASTLDLNIGRSPLFPDRLFAGQIDEVRLWDYARSAAQIRATRRKILPNATPGLAAYWRFNEGRGATLYDLTPGRHHGTLSAGPAWVSASLPYVYYWDTFASGFFGQSDDIVLRLQAYPDPSSAPNGAPVFQQPYASAATFPFRGRGTQVRVMKVGAPVSNAMVYRLAAGQTGQAKAIAPAGDSASGVAPFRTDSLGYLLGRGELALGDQLVALWPETAADPDRGAFTLYSTSAAPTESGLAMFTIASGGVQTLTVSSANPLLLFNLDVSLQWDARYDSLYLQQLQSDLQRAAELLYDWSNGQAALGSLRIFQNREGWDEAHIRVYANNELRPMALQGGIVSTVISDTQWAKIAYAPGQVHIGAVWNRYGSAGANLGEDWPRALAHELGHYAFYLNDNYLGLTTGGELIPVDSCPGAMTDPYRGDPAYSEFHFAAAWLNECATTLSNQVTGRSDWETIQLFYDALRPGGGNPGPAQFPLALTQIEWLAPPEDVSPIADPTFYLLDESQQRLVPDSSARAFLFQQGWAIDLGSVTQDHVLARGARPADELCVYDLVGQWAGCESVILDDEQLTLHPLGGWTPEVLITPVNSTTLQVEVSGVALDHLQASLYPFNQPLTSTISLASGVGTFYLLGPVMEGYLRLQDTSSPNQQMMVDFAVGGNPSRIRGSSSRIRGSSSRIRGSSAPIMSADGQVILFTDDTALSADQFYVLQAASSVPNPLAWATPVGRAYRLTASLNAPDLSQAAISFSYNPADVPSGAEDQLHIYYRSLAGGDWQVQPTTLDVYNNMASAACLGQGWYALMSSMEVALRSSGWNLFAYSLKQSHPVMEALRSLDGLYQIVYSYQPENSPAQPWKMYAPGVPTWANNLQTLEFGRGYWITVTQPVTLYLGTGAANAANFTYGADLSGGESAALILPPPPATFYGALLPGEDFTPTEGATVTAWVVNGQDFALCGEGSARLLPLQQWSSVEARLGDVSLPNGDLPLGRVGWGGVRLGGVRLGGVVYTLHVWAASAENPACGVIGSEVRFQVDGHWMATRATWNNDRVWQAALSPGYQLYLPAIVSGSR